MKNTMLGDLKWFRPDSPHDIWVTRLPWGIAAAAKVFKNQGWKVNVTVTFQDSGFSGTLCNCEEAACVEDMPEISSRLHGELVGIVKEKFPNATTNDICSELMFGSAIHTYESDEEEN